MSDPELHRLLAAEHDALARYDHIKVNFARSPEIVRHARLIWEEASTALLEYRRLAHLH